MRQRFTADMAKAFLIGLSSRKDEGPEFARTAKESAAAVRTIISERDALQHALSEIAAQVNIARSEPDINPEEPG